MDVAAPTQAGNTKPKSDRNDGWSGAVRWWEWRRLLYNTVLGAVFVALTIRTWPRLAPELTLAAALPLAVLALLANVCYSTAYLFDPVLRESPRFLERWRWALFLAGTLFAVLIETYWYLDEILPPILQ